MGVVRAPYLLAELKERGCANESALAQVMQPGCRIGEEDLRKLASNLGLEVSELAPAPENAANTRFKAKLRGGLASFLFEWKILPASCPPAELSVLTIFPSGVV